MLSIQGNLQHKHICNKVISEIDILCFIVLAAGSKKLGSIRPHDIFEYRWIITRHRCTTVATDGEAFISNAFVEHDDPLIWPNRHSGVGISLNSYNIVSIRQSRDISSSVLNTMLIFLQIQFCRNGNAVT